MSKQCDQVASVPCHLPLWHQCALPIHAKGLFQLALGRNVTELDLRVLSSLRGCVPAGEQLQYVVTRGGLERPCQENSSEQAAFSLSSHTLY